MESMPLIKAILLADTGVTSRMVGGIHMNAAPERTPLPHLIMRPVGGGSEGLTQSGPDGLLRERVRIWARATTLDAAIALGVAVDKALHGYRGTVHGAFVNQVAKVFSDADYSDGAQVQQAIIDFRIHWNRAP